jgi:hypothetical protein
MRKHGMSVYVLEKKDIKMLDYIMVCNMINKLFEQTKDLSIDDKLKITEYYTMYQTIYINSSGSTNINKINSYAYSRCMDWYHKKKAKTDISNVKSRLYVP